MLIGLLRFPDMLRSCGGIRFADKAIGGIVEKLSEYAFINDIRTPADLERQIEDINLTEIVQRAIAGPGSAFSFARETSPPATARTDLTAVLRAMRR